MEEINPHILKHKAPSLIYEELKKCVKHADKIKKHKLSCLLEHYNVGDNAYQTSVPSNLIEGSFLQAYLIYLGEYFRCKYENLSFQQTRRSVRMRKNENHFDGYDLWVNYAEEGSINNLHIMVVIYRGSYTTPIVKGLLYFLKMDFLIHLKRGMY